MLLMARIGFHEHSAHFKKRPFLGHRRRRARPAGALPGGRALSATSNKLVSPDVVAAYRPFSYEVEQLRAIRSQLMLRWFDRDTNCNRLAIVGAGRGAGRSYVAANLAVVFSQLGERTLLIDADLRMPHQHRLFRLENQTGLSSILAERADLGAIQQIPVLNSLSVLPAGPIPPNPLELLSRPTFAALLEQVSAQYDVVLIDTSCTSNGLDAVAVATRTAGALGVARTNHTRIAAYRELLQHLSQAGVTMVGSVLNDPPLMKANRSKEEPYVSPA